jgi:tryptophan 2,3-dioxygenase
MYKKVSKKNKIIKMENRIMIDNTLQEFSFLPSLPIGYITWLTIDTIQNPEEIRIQSYVAVEKNNLKFKVVHEDTENVWCIIIAHNFEKAYDIIKNEFREIEYIMIRVIREFQR